MMTQSLVTRLVWEVCCNEKCGVSFGMEEQYREQKKKDHTLFYCPNGHGQHYTAKTAVEAERDRLAKQLASTERCLQFAREAEATYRSRTKVQERQISARKGIITRMKRRLVAGRCVCCSRQFKDLETHMHSQHPDFNPEKGAQVLSEKSK